MLFSSKNSINITITLTDFWSNFDRSSYETYFPLPLAAGSLAF